MEARRDKLLPTFKDFIEARDKLTRAQQARLYAKCRWEHMIPWAVMNEWGLDWGSPEPEEDEEWIVPFMQKRDEDDERRAGRMRKWAHEEVRSRSNWKGEALMTQLTICTPPRKMLALRSGSWWFALLSPICWLFGHQNKLLRDVDMMPIAKWCPRCGLIRLWPEFEPLIREALRTPKREERRDAKTE